MALTTFQITVLKILTQHRMDTDGAYLAGGAALNRLLETPRRSRDLDFFHDTTEALRTTWDIDRKTLIDNGFSVTIERETASYIEANIFHDKNSVLIQWARDSAFRFFPLIQDPVLGTTLHPFDLATNKLLAMAGRLEPRDWIDTIECHRRIQPLGYLIWAACGKDPGVNPDMLTKDATRLHYSQTEIEALDFEGPAPTVATLSTEWKSALSSAKELISLLPDEHVGKCCYTAEKKLYQGTPSQLVSDLKAKRVIFHRGTIFGAWPQIIQ